MSERPRIVALKRKPQPDAELIAECRRLLELAEAGALATLAYVAEYTDDREPALYMGGDYDMYRTCGLLDALKALAMEDDA